MLIEHIQSIFSPEHGGPMVSLKNFALGQAEHGVAVRVRCLEGFRHTSPALRLADTRIDQKIFSVDFPRVSGRSPGLKRFLRAESSPDVYHLHGVWTFGQRYGMQEAQRRGVPYVVELMGGYQPEELERKPWRKRLFRRWFQDRLLHEANCIHTNSAVEAGQLAEMGFKGPFAPIPVGFDIAAADQAGRSLADYRPEFARRWEAQSPYILFLARVHPNKGVDVLLQAFARLADRFPFTHLVFAGPGAPAYLAELAERLKSLPGAARIHMLGFVTEREKIWLYRNATVYCLPSFSENYGATIQDALGHGTLTVTTWRTPWHQLENMGFGWLAKPEIDSLTAKLAEALSLPAADRAERGARASAWIRREYSLDEVIRRQLQLYAWLRGGPKPEFILSHCVALTNHRIWARFH